MRFVVNLGLAIAGAAAGPGRALLARLVAFGALVSRVLTPARALALVVAGGAVLLALSQFADYRGVSIGNGRLLRRRARSPPRPRSTARRPATRTPT